MSRYGRDTEEIERELAQAFVVAEGTGVDAQPLEIKRAIRRGEIKTPEAN